MGCGRTHTSIVKILVISVAGIGDTLLATPLLRALREQFPAALIDVLAMWPGSRDILEGNPCVNTIHQQNFFTEKALMNLKFLWRLRKARYDVTINTYPQSKTVYRVIARLINAPRRLSHRYENYSRLDDWLTNLTIEEDYTLHCIENNLNLLKLLGSPLGSKSHEPELFFSTAEIKWAEEFACKNQLRERTVLGIHAGSGKTKNLILKRWPVDYYIQLVQKLLAGYPALTVLLFGGPEEKEDNEKILQSIQSPRLLAVPSRTISSRYHRRGKGAEISPLQGTSPGPGEVISGDWLQVDLEPMQRRSRPPAGLKPL